MKIPFPSIKNANKRGSVEDFLVHGSGAAAQFAKVLAATGCNIADQRSLNFGMTAYNTALLVWKSYQANFKPGSSSAGNLLNRVGRNDPCPCGSGQKFKKCCLAKESKPQQAINQRGMIPFGPDIIPKIWDAETHYADMFALGELFEKDSNLKRLRFSATKVESFLKDHRYDSEFLQDLDKETRGQFIDKLAIQYAKESGEGRILKKATDLMLAAAKNVKSAVELRALASGVLFAAAYEIGGDVDNPLTAFIFRMAAAKVLAPISAIRKIAERLDKKAKFCGDDDPARLQAVMEMWDDLDKKEKDAIQKVAEDIHEDILKCLSEGKFPVGLPFAATLPFWQRASQLQKNGPVEAKDEGLIKIITEFGEALTDDDYRLLLTGIDSWFDENKERQDLVADSVRMLHMLVKAKSLAQFGPQYLMESCRQKLFTFIDKEESQMIEAWKELSNSDELGQYANLLEAKGYPQIATRTRSLIPHH